MQPLQNQPFYYWKLFTRTLAVTLILILLSACMLPKRTSTGYLRGNTILELIFPVDNGRTESIGVNEDRLASRAFIPTNVRSWVNTMLLPDAVWNDLERMRSNWCEHVPIAATRTPSDADFEVVFQCGHINNPAYYVHPADLPPELRALMQTVPSTDERLIVP